MSKAAFTLIYILAVYILLANKYINSLIYILKPKFTNSGQLTIYANGVFYILKPKFTVADFFKNNK